MPRRMYAVLRQQCKNRGIQNSDIARKIDRTNTYVSNRLNGKGSWTQSEMYTILDMLHISADHMHVVFPQDGKYAGELEDPVPSTADAMCSAIMAYITEINRGGKIA